jgi:serine protease Do/serine protease DegQ
MQNLSPELAGAFGLEHRTGALVAQVYPGSPADKAGLQAGDVILALNDRAIENAHALRNALGLLGIGERIKLDLLRDGRQLTRHAVLADLQHRQTQVRGGEIDPQLEGARLGPIESDHPLAGHVEGVEVLAIQRGSRAWSTGLRPGDIIVSVNQQPVSQPDDMIQAIRQRPGTLLLNIRRGNSALFVLIR